MSSVNNSFLRVSDSVYYSNLTNQKRQTEVSVNVQGTARVIKDPAQRLELVNELFKKFNDKDKQALLLGKKTYFKVGNRKFVIKPQSNLVLRILALFFFFFKSIENDSHFKYQIIPTINPFHRNTSIQINLQPTATPKIEKFQEKLSHPNLYSDPFTQISTDLFQKHERHHSWKDIKNGDRDTSTYQIVMDGADLVTKLRNDKSVTTQQKVATLKEYQKFITDQFGKRVIDRIQKNYGFNLDVMIKNEKELTPEIVYRMNVGTSYLEANDVQILADELKANKPLPACIRRRIDALNLTSDRIQRLDLKKSEDFAMLMSVLDLKQEDHERIFTGRKLFGKISSWYTNGDDLLYKPWVDQQEFAQTCIKIPGRNWDCFYEDLALILCKKHLHRKNEKGNFVLGVIISAPKEEGKPQYYYKVTSWINNSRGIFSYTLEPTCPNTSLPTIKLYRSTASSAYNLDGGASYKNDFNPINSPGYEGSHLLDKYEKDFFKKRTIPVWVGYQHLVKQELEKPNPSYVWINKNLRKASAALKEEIESQNKKETLKQFIRHHDSDFLELIQNARDDKIIGTYKAWTLLNDSLRNIVKFGQKVNGRPERALKSFLEAVAKTKSDKFPTRDYKKRAEALLSWWNDNGQKVLPTDDQKTIDTLNYYEKIKKPTNDQLEKLNRFLALHALTKGENIENKKIENIDFVGHSLGAACAQLFFVRNTSSKGRIPLPGMTISARIFDDPAINNEDNETFMKFGNKHGKLLSELKSKFKIVRRQEAGDFVPQSGETHLGAINPKVVMKPTETWLHFDAAVQKATKYASNHSIRDYESAHGRMFAAGVRKNHFLTKAIRQQEKKYPQYEKLKIKLDKQKDQLEQKIDQLKGKNPGWTKKREALRILSESEKNPTKKLQLLNQIVDLEKKKAWRREEVKLEKLIKGELREIDELIKMKKYVEINNIQPADYTFTVYDPQTQWNFDHPPSAKIWFILRRVWRLSYRYNPIFAERLRSYFSAIVRSGWIFTTQLSMRNPKDDENHGNWKIFRNADRVLCIQQS